MKRTRDGETGGGQHGNAKKQRKVYVAERRMTTRLMRRTSVSDAVFLTTELLERILGFLPMRDLFLAQRACRKWRDVIAGSATLQEKLFLKASLPKTAWPKATVDWEASTLQSLVLDTGAGTGSFEARVNPLCIHALSGRCRLPQRDQSGAFIIRGNARGWYEEGSWRRMFFTQPPATRVEGEWLTVVDRKVGKVGYTSEEKVSRPGGVTMGDLVDTGSSLRSSDENNVDWDKGSFYVNGMVYSTT